MWKGCASLPRKFASFSTNLCLEVLVSLDLSNHLNLYDYSVFRGLKVVPFFTNFLIWHTTKLISQISIFSVGWVMTLALRNKVLRWLFEAWCLDLIQCQFEKCLSAWNFSNSQCFYFFLAGAYRKLALLSKATQCWASVFALALSCHRFERGSARLNSTEYFIRASRNLFNTLLYSRAYVSKHILYVS